MRTDYPLLIEETGEALRALERRLRGQALADRVKMLRLLKEEAYDSRRALASLLGYSERQLQRWWELYRTGGLAALLEEKPVGGSSERVTAEARQSLAQAVRDGRVGRLREAQAYLKEHFNIEYRSLQGVSDVLRRHGIPADPA